MWENSADGLVLRNEDGVIVRVNEAFCRMSQRERGELEGQLFAMIFGGSKDGHLEKHRVDFRARAAEPRVEWNLGLADGRRVVWEGANAYVEVAGQPTLLLSTIRDVTAQRTLEEQLRRAQKLEAAGQLASGVAHDLNNILTVVQGHAALLTLSGSAAPGVMKSAQQIELASKRAADLTRQLLAFSQRLVMEPRRIDFNALLEQLTKTIGPVLGLQISLELKYAAEPALVEVDAGMAEQALLNLAVNARDAMPDGGQLEIAISHEVFDARKVARHPDSREGAFVRVTVADTGGGIAPEDLRRVFDPFFKAKGKGGGLGLATVYGIIKSHKGWVEVGSEPGRGTSFHLYFPAATAAVERKAAPAVKPASVDGNETILVVEDEGPLRDLVCTMLRRHGYKVLEAESGVKALDVWKPHKEKVDLLLTDLVMPDRINGRQLAEMLRAERPDLRIIYMSGYSAGVVEPEFVRQAGVNFLEKPYQLKVMLQTVRDSLDEKI
jgi:PAS domain S-box-containing protein